MQSSSRALVITGAVTGALLLAFGGYELLKPKPAASGTSIPPPGPVAAKINKGIPVQNGQGPASQSLAPTTGSTGSAQAVAGGSLAVTTQFQATYIVATPTGPTGPLASSFYGDDNSSIILTGNPGTITIYGPSPSSPYLQAPSVNVQVS
jgi:hypothetical protein